MIDISDPANPQQVGRYDLNYFNWSANAVAVSGHHAFVTAIDYGLYVLDVSDPANPRRAGYLDGCLGNVAVSEGRAYLASGSAGLAVIDVSRSANPQTVGRWHEEVADETYFCLVTGLTVVGDYAYARTVSR